MKNISFDVADGEFCILLGPSGCGKSTVLRLIAGLETATAGEIVIDGERVDARPPQARDIAFVFQSYALYPHMTVFENLAFSLRMRGTSPKDIDAKVQEAARLLEIDHLLDRRPQALSGGQRQRVALGRALVRRPKIFLFDEPLSNLDAALRSNMRVELARLHRRLSATVLYVTHDQAEALTLGDKIIVLDRGEIQQIGSASDIYHKPANVMVARFVGNPQMNLFSGKVSDNGSTLLCNSSRLDLTGLLQNAAARLAGQSFTVGVRPEDLHVVASDQGWIDGAIELIEDLGSDRFLHVNCGGIDVVARDDGERSLRAGEAIGLRVDNDRVHLFLDDKRIER